MKLSSAGRTHVGMKRAHNEDSLRQRLLEYYKKTAPLLGYYYAKGMLKGVDGMASIDDVTAQIDKVLEAL